MSDAKVVFDAESVEHFRSECRPLLDRLRAFFGWPGDPVVTARSTVGDFFEGFRDEAEYRQKWSEFAATLHFPVLPTDTCLAVARKLKNLERG